MFYYKCDSILDLISGILIIISNVIIVGFQSSNCPTISAAPIKISACTVLADVKSV
jgi:hypothetical protein